jgi:intracellular septation protein
MKFLFDFFPLIAFYAAYQLYKSYYDSENAIFAATAAIIVATIFQVAYNWLKHRKIEKMHIITVVLVTVFGGLTLILHDPAFIKWKVSVVNWLFGIVLIGSQFIGDKPIIERMLSNAIDVPRNIWLKLNITWALFFISMGFLNVYIFKNFDEETWVGFKVYGMLGLTFVFVVIQGIYLSRHIVEDKPEPKE